MPPGFNEQDVVRRQRLDIEKREGRRRRYYGVCGAGVAGCLSGRGRWVGEGDVAERGVGEGAQCLGIVRRGGRGWGWERHGKVYGLEVDDTGGTVVLGG